MEKEMKIKESFKFSLGRGKKSMLRLTGVTFLALSSLLGSQGCSDSDSNSVGGVNDDGVMRPVHGEFLIYQQYQ